MSLRGMNSGVESPNMDKGRGGGGVVVIVILRGRLRGVEEKIT